MGFRASNTNWSEIRAVLLCTIRSMMGNFDWEDMLEDLFLRLLDCLDLRERYILGRACDLQNASLSPMKVFVTEEPKLLLQGEWHRRGLQELVKALLGKPSKARGDGHRTAEH